MPLLHGRATFPGVRQIEAASYTRSCGISPGTATLEVVPQRDLISIDPGDFVIFDGQTTLTFPDCKADQASLRADAGGFVWSVSLFDRRWRWAFGRISGSYNVRRPDDSIDPATETSPRALAALCLDALGEQGYRVDDLPDDTRPAVAWDNDNPAQALDQLCQDLGCLVQLGLDDRVRVCRQGAGADLPPGGVESDSFGIKLPQRPDSLLAVGGKSRYQVDFPLQAVGLDVDGTVKVVDQLSYRPQAGWAAVNVPFFTPVSGEPNAAGVIPRELAKATVYRWYQVRNVNPDGQGHLIVPGWRGYPGKRLDRIDQVLPLEDVQVLGGLDAAGAFRSNPALVFGVWWDGGFGFVNTAAGSVYPRGFTLDRDNGIVQFRDYVYARNADGTKTPATLGLRCACSVRDPDTRAWERFERAVQYPNGIAGTGPRVLKHDEIVLHVVPAFDARYRTTGLTTTRAQAEAMADYYLAAADAEYQVSDPVERSYAGLVPLSPDGAIRQVSWSVGPDGPSTRASRNDEFHPVVPPLAERRAAEQVRGGKLRLLLQDLARRRAQKEKVG